MILALAALMCRLMNWHGMLRSLLRMACRALGVIAVIALAGFLYLSIQGFPRRLSDRWLGALRAQGYAIAVERVRLDLVEGVVADHVRWFEDASDSRPMLEADRVALFFNPLAWLRHDIGLRRLRVHDGYLRLEMAENPAAGDAAALIARDVYADVKLNERAWQVNAFSADLLGIRIGGRGQVRLAPQAGAPRTAAPGSETPRQLNALARDRRAWITKLTEQLNAISFRAPPRADISFQLDLAKPAAGSAAIRAEGGATRAFGVLFDRWRLRAELSDGRALLHEALLQQRDQHLICSGSYAFGDGIAAGRLLGRAIPQDWIALAPPSWRAALNSSGVAIAGPVRCDLRLGPAPLDRLPGQLHGWLEVSRAGVRGLRIENGFAGITLDDDALTVDPFFLLVGWGAGQGPAQGQLHYDLAAGDYEGGVETRFDPRFLAPLLSSNLAGYAHAIVFQDEPISCAADFSGRAGRADSLRIAGSAQASNLACHAVSLTSARTKFGYANGRLVCDGLRLERPEGAVVGRLAADLDGAGLDFDLVSTADPRAVARLIGPDVAARLDGFHFAGPMRIAAQGKIDFDDESLTELRAELDGRHWGYRRFHTARASLKASLRQRRLDVTAIRGEAFEGDFAGQASVFLDDAGTNWRYYLSTKIADLNLNTLLQAMGYDGREEYEGLVYAEGALSGMLGPGRGDSATGGGWIRIQDGQLYQLRLLGGFSRILSVLAPRLGVVNMTDFAASFAVTNRQIATTNAALSGPTLAIRAEGRCAFDERLDFIVWAQETGGRNPWLPRLAQATSPVLGRLLAVRLTGTLSDPKWWPLNLTRSQLLALPKDLLVDMPKNVLTGLPHDLLVTLPHEVLVTLPHDLLVELPKKIFIDLPEEIFIKLPRDLWDLLRPAPPANAKP